MTTDAILTELRALPGAPDHLRERVRALPEPRPRVAWTLPRFDVRRTLLVLAPAVLVLAVGAAALHGLLAGNGTTQRPVAAGLPSNAKAPALRDRVGSPAHTLRAAGKAVTTTQFGATAAPPQSFGAIEAQPLPPSPTRLNRYQAWLRVKVARDDLASAATHAMQIARGYGGYVASVDMNTPGSRGVAFLVLRVPVTKVEDAVLRLGKLGAVTAQHVRIQDLNRQSDAQERKILQLRTTIAKLELQLQSPSLPPAERIRLEYALEQAKHSLALTTKAHATTIREGTLAAVSVRLFVPQASVTSHHEGRLTRTTEAAGTFLVRELAWLLYALIVVGPIAVLAVLAVLGARTGRRRADRRLLDSA